MLEKLSNGTTMCEEINLVLYWKKYHFIVHDMMLGHRVAKSGIEVDKTNVEVVERLPPPTYVKRVCSFLGHTCFYKYLIKDFSNIATPLC